MPLIASQGSSSTIELVRVGLDPKVETKHSFLKRMFGTLLDRGRALLGGRREEAGRVTETAGLEMDLAALGEDLLSRRGEVSGVLLAERLLKQYAMESEERRVEFLRSLVDRFGPDSEKVRVAVEAYKANGTPETIQMLHVAAEPRRQELFRRLNAANGGTAALIRMREELLKNMVANSNLKVVDEDMLNLFATWFNRGFLVVRPIDWTTPAHILEKIIRYEAVHEIQDWRDLRRRLEPPDRRCFAFFHPVIDDEPLIFVEVALTRDIPTAIAPLLAADRETVPSGEATTAVFYSISNCQSGLRGISFGNSLIKQVARELKKSQPQISTFVTLSPVPAFGGWLEKIRRSDESAVLSEDDRQTLQILDEPDWFQRTEYREAVRKPLLKAAAHYFLRARTPKGRPIDPVARFHLGNGARLERLNLFGDMSSKGIAQSKGLMVNYLYDIAEIERNHEIFSNTGEVVSAPAVRRLLSDREST